MARKEIGMKAILLALLVAASAFGDGEFDPEIPVWTDDNGITWMMQPVMTTYARASDRCLNQGFKLPEADDFFEAADSGLFDPNINTAFGDLAKVIDFIWIRSEESTLLSFRNIAWRYGDLYSVPMTERHWALCSKK
jgi:hypothetical protein